MLDSQPGTVPVEEDAPTGVGRIISIIHDIPTPLNDRQQLYDYLKQRGLSQPLAYWLGSNLMPVSGDVKKLTWSFNLQGAAAMYKSYR